MAAALPSVRDFETCGATREQALQQLSAWIAEELSRAFEQCRSLDRPRIATLLIRKVESLVEELNAAGYSFGRFDYGGDINFEDSYQIFSSGERMGTGILLEFTGFACNVCWRDRSESLTRLTSRPQGAQRGGLRSFYLNVRS